jgi:hypothetical protein
MGKTLRAMRGGFEAESFRQMSNLHYRTTRPCVVEDVKFVPELEDSVV